MKSTLLPTILFLFTITLFSQSNTKESSSFGIGFSNFSMHGDLRSIETGLSNPNDNLLNLGAYLYFDKMITPSFGFETKIQFSKMSGSGQELSSGYDIAGTSVSLNNTRFEGTSLGAELNTIINLSNITSNPYIIKERKWNFSALLGVGFHRYNSKLYNINNGNLLIDFGDSPSKNGSTGSLYFTSGFALKYKLNSKLDLELRQTINLNDDDHLDAAVSDKQALDFFFTTNIGIVYKLNDKNHDNFIWQENDVKIDDILIDTDKDGVIDRFDLEKNTPPNTVVYGNGVAIDVDKDGVPDYKDKCPLVFAKTKNGCIVKDTDKDGVFDNVDKCPLFFAKTKNGCPKKIELDSDLDGVIDKKDKCPFKFAKTSNGCPKEKDSDGDGISDSKDKCPKIYAKNADGCPKKILKDSDKDGILNRDDKCPLTYAKTKNGCPIVPKKKIIPAKKITIKKPIQKTTLPINKPTIKKTTQPIKKVVVKKPTPTIKKVIVKKPNPEVKKIIEINKKNISHNIKEMNESININDIDISPVHPRCKKHTDEMTRKNCMITKISEFINSNYYNTSSTKSVSIVRTLFIIDEKGKTNLVKIIGSASPETKAEVKRIFNLLPKMTPGKLNNKIVPVKYSIKFILE